MSIKHILSIAALIGLLVGGEGCGPRLLFPQRVNTPMLSEQGEVKLTGGVKVQSSSKGHQGFSPSLEAAGAITNHVAVIASYYRQNKYGDDGSDDLNDVDSSLQYTGNTGEVGIGYYSKISSTGIFEVFGGIETGVFHRYNLTDANRNFQLHYNGFFIQPAVGWNFSDAVLFSLGFKATFRHYRDFSSPTDDLRYSFTTDNYTDVTNLDPVITQGYMNLSIGDRYGFLNIQTGLYGTHSTPALRNVSPFYFSFGATFSLAPRFKKNKNGHSFWGK